MNNIEHFNKNHDTHGRFTFGSGIRRARKTIINYDTGEPVDNRLIKTASKKTRKKIDDSKPLKNIREKRRVIQNKRIVEARQELNRIKKRNAEMSNASNHEKLEDAIKRVDVNKILDLYPYASDYELQSAKNRIDNLNYIKKQGAIERRHNRIKKSINKLDNFNNTTKILKTTYRTVKPIKKEVNFWYDTLKMFRK